MRKEITVLVAVALGATLLAAPASARAGKRQHRYPAGNFTIFGSGYGHGIGMSQYGALGLARKGWEATKIVRHYYMGVDVGPREAPAPEIRVGLLQDAGSARVLASHGAYDLLLQGGETIETVAEGQRRTVEVTGDKRFRVLRPDGSVVWEGGGPGAVLVVRRQGDARVRVPEWGHEAGRGELRFEVAGPSRAHLLAVVPVEEYLYGISEVPSSWPMAALGAQAIAARSYAYWRLAGVLRAGCACDVYSSVADQAYIGWDKEAGPSGSRWVQAVGDTHRTVATHQGDFIYSAYSSSSGGYTENIENVWPGSQPQAYLRGVCDPADKVADNPSTIWSVSLGASALTGGLRPYTGDLGRVTRFRDYDRGVSGRVTSVRVVGTRGSAVVDGWDVRTGLSLKDTRFSVNRNLNITGGIRQVYDGLGCRPGRATKAQKGVRGGRFQVFTRGRMYENDRRDAVVWLRGRVLSKYLQVGGHASRLRLPYRVRGTTRAWFDGGTITCAGGCRVRFA
jgi:stage II sporulation protein D